MTSNDPGPRSSAQLWVGLHSGSRPFRICILVLYSLLIFLEQNQTLKAWGERRPSPSPTNSRLTLVSPHSTSVNRSSRDFLPDYVFFHPATPVSSDPPNVLSLIPLCVVFTPFAHLRDQHRAAMLPESKHREYIPRNISLSIQPNGVTQESK